MSSDKELYQLGSTVWRRRASDRMDGPGRCSPAHFVAILSRIYDAFSVG